MIFDTLARSGRYTALHPAFTRVCDVLANRDVTALAPGRHEIDGDRMYISIDHREGRGRDGARLEAHRRRKAIVKIASTEVPQPGDFRK